MITKTLIAIIYLLIEIGISLAMFANSIKRNSTLGVVLSFLNIWIPVIPCIAYLILIYNEKISNASSQMQ